MATRKKASTPPSTENHKCGRDAEIGRIVGRLDAQEITDTRIENSINTLVKNYDEDRRSASQQMTDLKCEIARIGSALESSAKNSEQLISNQTEILKQISNIAQITGTVQSSQDTTQKMLEKHMHESDAWRSTIERRIGKLERSKWFWYTLIGILISAAGFLSYLASIYDKILKK